MTAGRTGRVTGRVGRTTTTACGRAAVIGGAAPGGATRRRDGRSPSHARNRARRCDGADLLEWPVPDSGSDRPKGGRGRKGRERAYALGPSHAVDLARLVADDVTDPAAVHAPRGRPAAARTAAAGETGVRVPDRRGGGRCRGGAHGGSAGVGAPAPRACRFTVGAQARTGVGDGAGRDGHGRVSPVRGAARGGPRPRRGRRPRSSGHGRSRATRPPGPRRRRRWRTR